jgi:DNA-binding transcriptional MerR regulator
MDAPKKRLADWTAELRSYRSPAWDKLPDIDLYMDQVILLLERQLGLFLRGPDDHVITPSMINNYVKLGLLTPTVNKKYNRSHIAHLMTICVLKQLLPISDITDLLKGQDGESGIAERYGAFGELQDQALHAVAGVVSAKVAAIPSNAPDMDERLNHLALSLTATANAHKLAAEKIVSLLQEGRAPKEKPKEKEKEHSKERSKEKPAKSKSPAKEKKK